MVIFQPAEENGEGAKEMVREGVVENVSAILGLHTVHGYPRGAVASRPGRFLAGCGSFKAVIQGHANADLPVLAASTSIISLQNIISRETDPLDSQVTTYFIHHCSFLFVFLLFLFYFIFISFEVVSVTMVQAGDSLHVATIAGTFRAFGRKSIYALRKRIQEVNYKYT